MTDRVPPSVFVVCDKHQVEAMGQSLMSHFNPLRRLYRSQGATFALVNIEEMEIEWKPGDIILLLITPRFMSDDLAEKWLPVARAARKSNSGSRVIPVRISPCLITEPELLYYRALPEDWNQTDPAETKDGWISQASDKDTALMGVAVPVRKIYEEALASATTKVTMAPTPAPAPPAFVAPAARYPMAGVPVATPARRWAPAASAAAPPDVAIFAADADADVARGFDSYVEGLRRQGLHVWTSWGSIRAGDDTEREWRRAESAPIKLMMVSVNYLHEDRCWDLSRRIVNQPGILVAALSHFDVGRFFQGHSILPTSLMRHKPVSAFGDRTVAWTQIAQAITQATMRRR